MNYELDNLPNPDKLAKQSRLGTKQVSIRIKDRTYNVFDRYANLYETTVGGIINSLLDSYAENIREKEQMESINLSSLNEYMKSAVKKLSKMTNEDLFLVSVRRIEFQDEETEMRNLYKNISSRLQNDKENPPFQLLHFENLRHMYISTDSRAHLQKNGSSSKTYTLFVPYTFWFFIAALLALYARQFTEYNHGYDGSLVLKDKFLTGLVSSINNSHSNSELAEKILPLFN